MSDLAAILKAPSQSQLSGQQQVVNKGVKHEPLLGDAQPEFLNMLAKQIELAPNLENETRPTLQLESQETESELLGELKNQQLAKEQSVVTNIPTALDEKISSLLKEHQQAVNPNIQTKEQLSSFSFLPLQENELTKSILTPQRQKMIEAEQGSLPALASLNEGEELAENSRAGMLKTSNKVARPYSNGAHSNDSYRSIFDINKSKEVTQPNGLFLNNEEMASELIMKKSVQPHMASLNRAYLKNQPEVSIFKNVPVTNDSLVTNGLEGDAVPFSAYRLEAPVVGIDHSKSTQMNLQASQTKIDMSHIQAQNSAELINKITDYLVQNQVETSDTLELQVTHKDLGQFDIKVNKAQGEQQLMIEIATHSKESKDFFQQHQRDLTQSLQRSGLQVADVKIESGSLGMNNNSQGFQKENSEQRSFAQDGRSQQQFQENRRDDSQRRQNLWSLYQQQSEAA